MDNNSAVLTNKSMWREIDYLKGILVCLVFWGHIIPGKIRETFPRYFIYSFHMPLFIGISGFLLDIENIKVDLQLIKRQYFRLVRPWVISILLYYVINTELKPSGGGSACIY